MTEKPLASLTLIPTSVTIYEYVCHIILKQNFSERYYTKNKKKS